MTILKEDLEFRETMGGEIVADVYCGAELFNHENRWTIFAEGDKDSDLTKEISMKAEHFSPGTKIRIEEPMCPECEEIPTRTLDKRLVDKDEDGNEIWDYEWVCGDGCDFNWRKFAEDNYS